MVEGYVDLVRLGALVLLAWTGVTVVYGVEERRKGVPWRQVVFGLMLGA